MKIPISEIFESIQWEWRNTGKPSIFIRFWGCNLACTWCDSTYSWDATVEKANMMELEEVIKIIKSFDAKHIIFTGWEPTLFQKQMKAIQYELRGLSYTYELETNWSKELEKGLDFDQINISPKLKSSWNKDYKINILDSAEILKYTFVDFKFVCSNLIDTKETDDLIKSLTNKDGFSYIDYIDDIYIMPLWRDEASQVNDFLIKYCIKNNYKYCLRQHLIMFWDGKGK